MKKRLILVLVCSALLFSVLPLYSQEIELPELDKDGLEDGLPDLPVDEAPTEETAKDTTNGTAMSNTNQAGEFDFEDMGKIKGASLYDTVKQGGPLMIVLIIFSIISLTLIIERVVFFTKNKIWDIKQLDIYIKNKAKQSKAKFREDMEDDLRKEFQLYCNRMEKGFSLLSGIGQLSPIVGFLGTVLGMIRAFASIAMATTVNAKVVAVGIQIALITTAGGLLIAAPTLTCFYFFMHIIQNRYARSEEIINDICKDMPKLSGKIK